MYCNQICAKFRSIIRLRRPKEESVETQSSVLSLSDRGGMVLIVLDYQGRAARVEISEVRWRAMMPGSIR